ncbi:ribosome small subunit-dependent GTPase A [Carboxylicivirga sp. RSCT41]|uniref:ribosome small subunit-dependent GTPase A n=1 Tax=Carboxylicivirga agarovorans TaxID=3417570 RepID=UPI003D344F03
MCTSKLIGRIVEKQYNTYKVQTETGLEKAHLKGKNFQTIQRKREFPCVGDWVVLKECDGTLQIEKVLERRTQISRQWAGNTTEEQVIASNIDYVVIVLGLDGGRNYSDRLLERLTTVAWNSGATPLVVLNKADLNDEAEYIKFQAETIAPGVDIIATSVEDGTGIDALTSYLSSGKVAVFIGPSGVGKSTLTNALLKKEVQKTNAIRQKDKRGRHTTSTSFMFELESGGHIIDSPGLREVQAWAEEQDLDDTFSEIAELAQDCRFSDCKHEGEPGCAVQAGLEKGMISPERYDSYLHLKKELAFLNRRKAEKNSHVERQFEKQFSKMVKREMSKKQELKKY